MLLGAAKYLAETRNFAGSVAVIFQPAEEGGGGGNAMVKDGMMERFGIEKVFGMHNMPGLPVGQFAIRAGPDHGGDRRVHHHRQGPRRPCRHAAHRRSTRSSSAARSSPRCRRSPRAPSIRSSRWSSRSPSSMPATPTTSSPRRRELAGTVRTLKQGGRGDWPQRAHAGDLRRHRAGHRRDDRRVDYDAELPGHRQPSRARPSSPATSRRRSPATRRSTATMPAGDGRRGFLLHAGGAARRLHLHRQWRHAPTSTTRPTTSTTRPSRTASATG